MIDRLMDSARGLFVNRREELEAHEARIAAERERRSAEERIREIDAALEALAQPVMVAHIRACTIALEEAKNALIDARDGPTLWNLQGRAAALRELVEREKHLTIERAAVVEHLGRLRTDAG